MKKKIDNIQLYYDPLAVLDEACLNYRTSLFGMINPNKSKMDNYRAAKAEYKRAIRAAIMYLRNELKSVEESCWSDLALTVNEREEK